MIDTAALRQSAQELRSCAQQFRRDNETAPYATAGTDANLLERAAKELEEAAAEIERLADDEFSYRHNSKTGRWDVVMRSPDGSEEVLHSFDTPGRARDHVAQLTVKETGPPFPDQWTKRPRG